MAWIGEGVWFNQFSNEVETVNGVYCDCWDCTYAVPHDQLIDGGVFFTKSEYREHQKTRRRAYFDRKRSKQAVKDGKEHVEDDTESDRAAVETHEGLTSDIASTSLT